MTQEIDFNPDYVVPDINQNIENKSEADRRASEYNSCKGNVTQMFQTVPGNAVLGAVINLAPPENENDDIYISDAKLTQIIQSMIAIEPRIIGMKIFGRVVVQSLDGYTPKAYLSLHQRYEKDAPVIIEE